MPAAAIRRPLLIPDRPSSILFGRIAASALGLVNAPLVARALGPDGRGETAAALAAFYLVPILLSMGLPLEVRRLAAGGDYAAVVRSARWVAAALVVPALAAGLLCARYLLVGLSPGEAAAAVAGVALAPLMVVWMCDESVLLARQSYAGVALLQLTLPLANTALLVAGALLQLMSVSWVMLSYSAGTVLTACVGWALVRVRLRGPVYPLRRLVRGGATFAGGSAAEAASNRADQLIALPLIGAAQAGYYSVAVTIASIPVGLAHALGASELRRLADTPPELLLAAQQAAVRRAVAIGAALCVLLAAATPAGLAVLFGPEFGPAVPATWILLGGAVLAVLNYVASTALLVGNRGRAMTWAQAAGAVSGVVFLLLAGPLWGAAGAAAAAGASSAVAGALLLRSLGGGWRPYVPGPDDLRLAWTRLVTR
ncbi:MAG: oligosaccharide flippase family protein [Arthrobacter sp.]|uniref:lipopolysaccharide biosynthesis protein n=1 Tax=Arthrobacter sp. TaxID=1667 RepID=UPI00347499E3